MLQEYFDEYTIHYGVKIHLETGGHNLVGFSPMVATQLLRIIQEALTNIRKHAKVNNARVRFHELGDQAIISIEDEGLGFDDEQIGNNDEQQFGLKIMRERAESVGGCLEIKSRPGVGTSIIIWVPFTNN
jgi:signal transduction histidine kinase